MLLARNDKTQHRNGNAKKTRAATVAVPDAYSALREKVEARTARVGIIGLGYVGLPLARTFAAGGFPVLGFDVDPAKVAKLRRNQSYIAHITPDILARCAAKGSRRPTDFARLAEADAVIICVPTPLTESREPDLTYVVKSAEAVARRSAPASSSSSRAPPTRARRGRSSCPILEATGLKAGTDFFLAFSPEREDPGNPHILHSNHPQGRRRPGRDEPASWPPRCTAESS